jgi:hypothetical protein
LELLLLLLRKFENIFLLLLALLLLLLFKKELDVEKGFVILLLFEVLKGLKVFV